MREVINPYDVNKLPESRRDFFGRDELVIWLEQQFIARRRVLLLHGPKQIGKTTFLHFLPTMLTPRSIPFIFSLSQMTYFSINTLLVYVLNMLTEQSVQQGHVRSEKITTAADPVSGINDILTLIQTSDPGAELLFLFDDFDRILELPSEDQAIFLDEFQNLLEAQPSLRYIVTVNDVSLPHLHHPILDSAPTRQITTLTGDSALKLVTQPVEGVIRFDYGVSKRITELNSNHPYYLTLFNQVLFNHYAREGWVNLRHLDATLEAVLDTSIPGFEEIWQKATRVERAVLSTMASVKGSHGVLSQQEIVTPLLRRVRAADDQIVLTALESLTFQGVLVKMGAMSYRFHVDLFRYWLQRHYDLDSVLADVVWKEPGSRSETVDLPVSEESDEVISPIHRRRSNQWSAWMIGGIGIVTLGVLLLGGLLLRNNFRTETRESGATDGVTGLEVVTPITTITSVSAAPEVVLTATPTPPLVVARSLPSIVYMARQGESPWQIHVMGSDGTGAASLSDFVADDTTPVWSTQGDRIAFVSQRDNNREIYVMDSNGQNLINFSNNAADDWTPAWSPDGSKIAFSSNRRGHWEVFIANANGSDLQQITNTGTGNISPVWSPDGEFLTFSSKRDGNWEIYSMRADGTEVRRLTNNNSNDLAPVWSFSGEFIAYETNVDGNVEVYVMTRDGESQTNVSSLPYADDHGPVWSPDDQRLVFYSNREGNWDLYSVGVDGTGTINLTNTPDIDEQTPAWRP